MRASRPDHPSHRFPAEPHGTVPGPSPASPSPAAPVERLPFRRSLGAVATYSFAGLLPVLVLIGASQNGVLTPQRGAVLASLSTFLVTAAALVMLLARPGGELTFDFLVTRRGWVAVAAVPVSAIVALVGAFANWYWFLSQDNAEAFNISLSKLDAVYFTVTTLTTTGFGDVQPLSQAARAFVTGQMIVGFLLVTLTVAVAIGRFTGMTGDSNR